MNSSDETLAKALDAQDNAVLVREAGVPFQPPLFADPIAEWMSLMEVVQMLCPQWPVRDKPMQGGNWKL
jgi:hypothetical protein